MQLSESKLFTIEALNRIDGFVWPEGAQTARVDAVKGDNLIQFFCDSCWVDAVSYSSKKPEEINWRNSLITKAEFDSVDGWVRNTKMKLPAELVDSQIEVMFHNGEIAFDDANAFYWDENVSKWRYHKPINETTTPTTKPEIHSIYERYKQQRATTADAQRALDASKDAEDALLEKIKQWNMQYGFDVRLLDESEEKPESTTNN